MASMVRSVKEHDQGRGLLIYDGPVSLYPLTGHRPMSPLVDPMHINYAIEENVSHLNTAAEVKRMLALNPGVVTMAVIPRNNPVNLTTLSMVQRYVAERCKLVNVVWSSEMYRADEFAIYGDCTVRASFRRSEPSADTSHSRDPKGSDRAATPPR